ncbi:MAG TPA: hypothetical protein VNZ86_07015, partial [Bacteroidia bacterium]|nr:hypothetical protein [Bacteroidia bacterium]
NGPATYYNGNGLVYMQGSYKDDKKEGVWMKLDGADAVMGQSYYSLTPEEQKSCHYVKYNLVYKDDQPVNEGKMTLTFSPLGKTFREVTYSHGKIVGDNISYYPSGKVQDYAQYDSLGRMGFQQTFAYPGCPTDSLKSFVARWQNQQKEAERRNLEIELKKKGSQLNKAAWNQLVAKDFKGAVASCEEGVKCDSSSLYLQGNLAHSYLLTGQYDKAIAIYRKYLGRDLDPRLSWNNMIKQDFADFRSKGIESEYFDRVLTELNLK